MAKLQSGKRPLDMPTFLKPEQMDFEKRSILTSSIRTQISTVSVSRDIMTAHSILKADTAKTPDALTVAEQTLVGRITGGVIAALTPAQILTLLGLSDVLTDLDATARVASGILTAGAADAFTFSWQNPNSFSIIVLETFIEVTTASGTADSVVDVGSAVSATTHGDNLILNGDISTVRFLYSSHRTEQVWSSGECIVLDEKDGATDYITGQILTDDALSLAGKYYIRYIRR